MVKIAVLVIFLCVALVTLIIVDTITLHIEDVKMEHLVRENWMFWQLLSEQAKLHEMSLEAYLAMLWEAQRYIGR